PEQNPLCRIVDIGRESEGRFFVRGTGREMSRPTQEPLDRMAFPLTLRGELRATFADIVSSPLPRRLSALTRRLNAELRPALRRGRGHGASAPETWSRIDRRGRR